MTAGLLRVAGRVTVFALTWLVLTDADSRNLVLAVVTIGAASLASLWLWPPHHHAIRWMRLPPLVGFFLWHSLRGGVDVARRAFSPGMPVDPALIRFESDLAPDAALVLFVWIVGLMPGTAALDLLPPNEVVVHVIDRRTYDETDLRRLERQLLALFR